MSVDAVRRKSEQLQDNARRRSAAFYAMGAANAGIPLVLMWFLPELRLGLGYLVLTAVFLVSYVRRRSGFRTVSTSMTPAQGIAFCRDLLTRERDFRRHSTRWTRRTLCSPPRSGRTSRGRCGPGACRPKSTLPQAVRMMLRERLRRR